MIDITKIRLVGNKIIVQELSEARVGLIHIPGDHSHGMQARVLAVAQTERSTLCEDIYPDDIALVRGGAFSECLGERVFLISAVDICGVIRDGVPLPVNDYVMVRVDAEKDAVDPATGLWAPTEANDFPATGWAEWEGRDWHVHYNVLGSQRRIRLGGQVYAFMLRDNLTGLVE
jgi:hypothetical protein